MKFNKAIIANILISAIIGVGIFVYFFTPVQSHTLEIIQNTKYPPTGRYCYTDFNFDNQYEKLCCREDTLNKMIELFIHNPDGTIINQWNINGQLLYKDINSFHYADTDRDSVRELYFLTKIGNKLLLNQLNVGKDKHESFLLDTLIKDSRGNYSYTYYINSFDLNSNGNKEVIVNLRGYFSTYPRKLYIFDPENLSIKSSHTNGNCFTNLRDIADIDNDSNHEIFGLVRSPYNIPSDKKVEYSDSLCWLFLFNKDLDFLFEPISFNEKFSSLNYSFIKYKNNNCILSLLSDYEAPKTEYPFEIRNKDGILINQFKLKNIDKISSFYVINDSKVLVRTDNHNYYIFDIDFPDKVKPIERNPDIYVYHNKANPSSSYFFKDLPIHIFSNQEHKNIVIYNSNFKNPVSVNIPNSSFLSLYDIKKTGNDFFLAFNSATHFYLLKYSKLRFHKLTYLLIVPIVLFILLILTFYNNFQKHIILKEQRKKEELLSLQIKTIKNRIEPHFLFNTINTIGSLIMQSDKRKAYEHLGRLSDLLRKTVDTSEQVAIPLEAEINFIANYLVLEKLRFEDKFDYEIKIDKNVNLQHSFPRMLMQIHVENAVKHGLMHKKNGAGLLEIDINQTGREISISIKDNGIGRIVSVYENTHGTRNGIKISEKIIELYNVLFKEKIHQEIIDLTDDIGEPTGTQIKIEIKK
jgi:hypothetical protein